MFKVVMKYPDGSTGEEDELFETKEEDDEFGLNQCSNCSAGAEMLHLHNPGDCPAPEDEDDVDFDVIGVEG